MIYNPEAPGYIIDEESVRVYGRIMHQLTSEILHGVLTNHFGITRSMWQTKNILSSLLSSRIFLTDLKAAVKSEVQKELNLERTDLQMKEILLTLCKYRSTKRDRVDYILIQELHKEELQWVDYSADQITVKMKLSEEIFSLLLEDTISVLKHMYMTPSF
ncbi:centrosome-associated protein 350 isoform X3 [Oncorhynchus tshawytscha]|nr:centrosome-associated protein 350 isoform X3 [Oncorhynchus tshawytscha]